MSAPDATVGASGGLAAALVRVTGTRRWTIVFLLFLASLINYFDRATISFALPLISKDLGLAPSAKGALLSAFFWSYALMQIPMGLCADRFNLRWVYAGAFALWSVAQGLTGFAGSLGAMMFFRVLLGIGEAIYLPGGTKVVSYLFPVSERGFPCGLFDFGTRTGLVLEGYLIPWLVQDYGWRKTFAIVGFAALIWLVPWFMFTPKELGRTNDASAKIDLARVIRRLLAILKNRDMIGICLGFFCFDYYWYLLVTWLPDYMMTVRKLDIMKAGISAALPFLVFGLSQPAGGWLADALVRRGFDETRTRKWIITLSYLTGLLLIPAAYAPGAKMTVALVCGGCLVGLGAANMLVILQHCAPPEELGLWVGVYNFVGNMAGVLAPLATGILIDRTGSYTPAFVLAALLIAAGQLSFQLIVGRVGAKK